MLHTVFIETRKKHTLVNSVDLESHHRLLIRVSTFNNNQSLYQIQEKCLLGDLGIESRFTIYEYNVLSYLLLLSKASLNTINPYVLKTNLYVVKTV